jgi:hypothetical protein
MVADHAVGEIDDVLRLRLLDGELRCLDVDNPCRVGYVSNLWVGWLVLRVGYRP